MGIVADCKCIHFKLSSLSKHNRIRVMKIAVSLLFILSVFFLGDAQAKSMKCSKVFASLKVQRIGWKDIEQVETHLDPNSGHGGWWIPGWTQSPEGPLLYGRGFWGGQKVFIKKFNPNRPSEFLILQEINKVGLGPELLAVFRKYHGDWAVMSFVEGFIFRFNYNKVDPELWVVAPTRDGSGYIPHWQSNSLIGKVNQKTIQSATEALDQLSRLGIAAHDFQFMVQKDGSIRIMDVGHYEYTKSAEKINNRIRRALINNLKMLMDGRRVPAPRSNRGGDVV